MSIQFGVTPGGTGLKFQSATEGTSGSTAEAMDEDGNIIQTDVYAKKRTFQGEALVTDEHTEKLKVGDKFTYNGIEYTIDRADYSRTNTGHEKVSISGSAPMPVEEGGGTSGGATGGETGGGTSGGTSGG